MSLNTVATHHYRRSVVWRLKNRFLVYISVSKLVLKIALITAGEMKQYKNKILNINSSIKISALNIICYMAKPFFSQGIYCLQYKHPRKRVWSSS